MRFLFDVNLSQHMVRGIAMLEKANRKSPRQGEIHHAIDFLPQDAIDRAVIEQAQKLDAIVITQDQKFGRIEHEYTVLKEFKVGVVYWKPPKGGLSYWDMVTVFINKWEDLKLVISQHKNPSAYVLEKNGKVKWLAHTH